MAFQKLSAAEYFSDKKQKEKEEQTQENTISSFIEQKNNEKKFSKQIASDIKKQQEQEKTQEKQPFVRQPASYTEGDSFRNAGNRIANALEGLSYSTTGAVDALFGTIISTHTPHARRDPSRHSWRNPLENFYSHASCEA